ncbi:PucR family transcriptional regulator [Carnobacterium funditum]|uniref:PucR family transcriptional regulator n=1 Tax=Carnobacterium funditum TaxID=2752 RepID=UPI00055670F4|nr:PucR family transcriptional regulator [Carnobacterium funditum]
MNLTVKELLDFDSLKEASVLTKHASLENNVTGIMVVEGPDIENWGREGELLLSSYYALKDLSSDELKEFFTKVHQLKISGLIIKIDRVVVSIPTYIIELCEKNDIPLIQIPKQALYEPILLDVTGKIINNNIHLLEKYYSLQNHFTKMALNEPELIDILNVLKDLIKKPISLKNTLKNDCISTDPLYNDVLFIQSISLNKQKYMNYDYTRRKVASPMLTKKKTYTQLVIPIPNLKINSYELIVHEIDSLTPHEDFLAIENTISFLQMELLKKYAVSQTTLHYKNSIISDLLNNRIEDKEELNEKINNLKLLDDSNFRIFICHLPNISLTAELPDEQHKKERQFAYTFVEDIKKQWPQRVYLIRNHKIVFIMNTQEDAEETVKKKLLSSTEVSKKILNLEELAMTISFSYKGDLSHLPSLYKQAQNAQKIITLFGEENAISSYHDIGIYQLFADMNQLEQFEKFIPESLLTLSTNHPDLVETLKAFLDKNQNYKDTADTLFLHPKTVRYRLDKIKKLTGIQFDNAEELLQINIGLRLLKMMKK